jgi:polyisoprenoid-binding protein YceI
MRGRCAGQALALLLITALPAAAVAAGPGQIRFEDGNLLTKAEGEFHDWRIVSAVVDEAEPEKSRVELEVSIASLDTGIAKRDDHLRSHDFFDVEKFPVARVTLAGFRLDGESAFTADVTLELRGKSKTFPMRFRIEDRAARRISGSVTLDRRDFGVGEPHSGLNPLSVRDAVEVMVTAVVPPAGALGAAD